MADSGIDRTTALHGRPRTTVLTAANGRREQMARLLRDATHRHAGEGLPDRLDPSRLLARNQREQADPARHAATAIKAEPRAAERRAAERRTTDRRDR